MVCPSCLIALAGFGDDTSPATPVQTLPTEVGTEVLGSLAYVVGGPVVGSLVLTIIGAVAWRDHRVAGGALGFVGGGLLGGLIGSYLAKRKIEAVLPQLQSALDQAADASVPVTPEGSFSPPAGGWTIGPLALPAGSVKAPNLLPGNVSVAPLQLLGLLNLAAPPAPNSAGPLKMSIPVKQPTAPAASAWKVPNIKVSSPVVAAPTKVPALRLASSYGTAATKQQVPNIVAVPGTAAKQQVPNIVTVPGTAAGAPYDPTACRSQCAQTFGQKMLTGDTSGWYQCWAACAVAPPAVAASSAVKVPTTRTASSYGTPTATATASTSVFARIGSALQTALAPKTALPSSEAVHVILPGQTAVPKQPNIAPVISSTARQVVLPTAAANTSSYGAKPAVSF